MVKQSTSQWLRFGLFCLSLAISVSAQVPVALTGATATHSQEFGDFLVGKAIDGQLYDNSGWSIHPKFVSQTAVFETVENAGYEGGTELFFTIWSLHNSPVGGSHTLGRFRLSITTDERSAFADGLSSGGDVSANWIVLEPMTVSSTNGAPLTVLEDSSILASGPAGVADVYSIVVRTGVVGITGVRLEALEHPSLPENGPGRHESNGNFAVSEFEMLQKPLRLDLSIVDPLQSSAFALEETAILEVSAVGWNLTYAWEFQGETIPNATSARLEIPDFDMSKVGEYAVVVTDGTNAVSSRAFINLEASLANATATHSQALGEFWVSKAIDGNKSDNSGWAIHPAFENQTAVFETVSDLGFDGGTELTFKLHFNHRSSSMPHTLGKFRLSVTTDPRASFADGAHTSGDVEANWTVLQPIEASAASGAQLTMGEDGSILVSGTRLVDDLYTIRAISSLSGITGVRLEALKDESLPSGGPGRADNGNFALAEFSIHSEPMAPIIGADPGDQEVAEGGDATLSVAVTSYLPVQYQWFFNGYAIEGATGATLTLENVQNTDAGTYSVRVSSLKGTVESRGTVVTVLPTDAATAARFMVSNATPTPAPLTGVRQNLLEGPRYLAQVYVGLTPETLVATSPAVPFLQGEEAGYFKPVEVLVPLVDAGEPVYAQVRVWDSASGSSYEETVAAGGERGASAIIAAETGGDGIPIPDLEGLSSFELQLPPVIITQSSSQTVTIGEAAIFQVEAFGSEPLSYQWKFDGVEIPGATSEVLTVEDVHPLDAGIYSVVVSNDAGVVVSADIELTVDTVVEVALSNATATFSQDSGHSVGTMINGTIFDYRGWGIHPQIGNQTAVVETVEDIGFEGGTVLTFELVFNVTSSPDTTGHTLGRFRLAATSDDRNHFADGLSSNGDVNANWVNLNVLGAESSKGAVLTQLDDGSILVSGVLDAKDIYTITAQTFLTGITGFRLEALTHESLPHDGPGREPLNGNFHVSEFLVTAKLGSPIIVEQPESLTVVAGASAELNVVAESELSPTYQWYLNGLALEGQTGATLAIEQVESGDGGTYLVQVSTAEGTAFSTSAVLTVLPSNAGMLAAFKVSNGEPVEARVTSARGALLEGARYLAQVYAGATAEALVPVSGAVPFLTGADAGLFVPVEVYVPEVTPGNVVQAQVRVWDSAAGPSYDAAVAAGGERGASAVLAVTTGGNGLSVPFLQGLTSFGLEVPPSIVTQPVSVMALLGEEAVFEVEAFGTGTLSYQWFFNETNVIAEATSSTLVLTNVQLADTGKYSVEVSNALGTAVSATADLVVEIAPTVTLTAPLAGETFATEVTLAGTVTDDLGIESVRWERNGTPGGEISLVDGAFSVPGVQLVRGNNVLRVIAVDSSGNESSAEVTLTQKASRTLFIGELEPHQEGARVNVPIYLDSRGDVGGMEFALRYSRSDFVYLETVWEPASAGALTTVSTNGFGLTELNLGLALSGTAFAEGTQHVATVVFRPLTVSGPRNIGLPLYLKGLFAPTGNQIPNTGTDVKPGSVQITPRKYVGDNNANDRLDVSDASAIMRLISRLDIPRMWDTGKNDLNENQRLDAGDVIKVLRVVVGLDPQPGEEEEPEASFGSIIVSAGVSEPQPGDPVDIVEVEQHSGRIMARMADAAGLVLELSNEVGASGEKLVRLKVRLADGVDRLSGASFRLDYPVEALRLEGASAHKVGALVPGDATSIWNVSPAQNDYSRQDGRVLMAVTSDNDWTQTEGVLAEFTFVVQEGAQDRYRWPITVSQAELSSGLELVTPEGASVYFTTREAAAANLQGGVAIADGAFQLSLSGEVGEQYRIEVSEDLETWSELTVILNTTGQIQLSDPIPAEGGHRFYRAAQVD